MLRRRVWLLNCFIILTIWSIGRAANCSEPYEPWKGEVTTRVNVRQAPGETSHILTQIDEGVEVTISDEKEGWFKVVVEKDTFGFVGWVYGRYVRNPAAASPTSYPPPEDPKTSGIVSLKPLTPAVSHVASTDRPSKDRAATKADALGAVEKSVPADDKVTPVIRQKEMTPGQFQAKRSPDVPQHRPVKKSTEKKETSRQLAMREAVSEDRVPPYEVPVQKNSKEVDNRHVSTPEPSLDAGSVSPAEPLERTAPVPIKELRQPSPKSESVNAYPRKKGRSETEATGTDVSRKGQGVKVMAGVLVKLVVVAFSCLALIFAYRAWHTTNTRKDQS